MHRWFVVVVTPLLLLPLLLLLLPVSACGVTECTCKDESPRFESSTGACISEELWVASHRARPCSLVLDEVCGCDGRTYSNACFAVESGVQVAYETACWP